MPSDDLTNQSRRHKNRLRAQYGSLFDEIAAILFRHDPDGINFETNTDEYEPEAMTILPRLDSARSADDVQKIVREEFKRWFGSGSTNRGGRRDRAAVEIWHLWCKYQER